MENKSTEWKDQVLKLLFTPLTLLRLVGNIMIIHIIAFIFGIGIFVIILSLTLSLLWFFPYWQPAYSVMYKICGNKNVSPILLKPKFPKWKYISISLRLAVVIYLIYVGLSMLFNSGFCAQSLICT